MVPYNDLQERDDDCVDDDDDYKDDALCSCLLVFKLGVGLHKNFWCTQGLTEQTVWLHRLKKCRHMNEWINLL
jgi:hypothetical protein